MSRPQRGNPLRAMEREDLGSLFSLLTTDGYTIVGPTVRDGAIVYDDVARPDDLPVGWTDEQSPGHYRLIRRGDDRYFGYVVGPHSWKRYLFPPREHLVTARRQDRSIEWTQPPTDDTPIAMVGVRACEISAIAVQDRVFLGGPFTDPRYRKRRESSFIVAVNCLEAGALCFCDSMDSGPQVESGFDLCLTELDHVFLLEAGSERGCSVLDRLPTREATRREIEALAAGIEDCRASMGRSMDVDGLPELLFGNLDHPRWDEVAKRCLSCANCTLVCPTCFCFSVREVSDLTAETSVRERSWDSCFTQDHSRINGATFRPTVKDRYRQWLTHKLGSWHSQFGTSGCVGCGRCIAWCPVGIDLTEEIAALRRNAAAPAVVPSHRPVEPVTEGDPLLPVGVRILQVRSEAKGVVTLELASPPDYRHRPGQFNMLSLPGVGEVPISVSGRRNGTIEHTIRTVGATTHTLCNLTPGHSIGLRGPFGSAWPSHEGRNRPVTVVAGGIGLAPLRETLHDLRRRADDFPWVRLVYGARSPADLLFADELNAWRKESRLWVGVTVDRSATGWTGNVGPVTALLHRKDLPSDGLYLICGPEVMMRVVIRLLENAGVPAENIYLSMERNMQCAAGFCGRCQFGPYFICKDGPVFRYDEVAFLFGREGF